MPPPDEKCLVIEARIFVAVDPGADEEAIASSMDHGLRQALEAFPDGEVTGADVDHIREANAEELSLHFEE